MTVPPAVDRQPRGAEHLILTVDVTGSHIRLGQPEACTQCPIALALLERLSILMIDCHPIVPVTVTGERASVRMTDDSVYAGTLPWPARAFVHHFDHGPAIDVHPFRFHLHLRPTTGEEAAHHRDHHEQHRLLGPREREWGEED